jgi:hypothetical protein
MGRWFDPRDGQIKWAPDQPKPPESRSGRTYSGLKPVRDEPVDHTARLAIHEACHAVAHFIFGHEIGSAEIYENEGVVRYVKTDDPFENAVSLLAPRALETMFGWKRSGDAGPGSDEYEVMSLLRRNVASASIPEALAVLKEAADELVSSARFDTLRRALSSVLVKERILQGVEIEEILREADERHARLTRKPTSGIGRHSSSGPRIAPWYIVSLDGRELYHGPSLTEAKRVQAQHAHSKCVGSIYG